MIKMDCGFGKVCVSGLNVYCVLKVAFINRQAYPNSYYAYAFVGIIALFVCLIFCGLYFYHYHHVTKKIKSLLHLLDALVCFVYGLAISDFMDNLILRLLDATVN